MADRILHKRSLTAGSVPSTSSLELGELAINVNDAKVFLRKSGSSGESVEALVSTNTLTSGSIFISGSVAITGSLNVTDGITGSLAGTASYALNANTASHALTASSADNFTVRGTLTAQTIVAQVITSSTEFITGSTIFGSSLSDTHQFTGSVSITGSLVVNNSAVITSNQTSSMSVFSSSYAATASLAPYYTLTSSFNTFSQSYVADSASFDTRINNLTESVFTHIVTNNGASNYIIDGVAKPILSFVPGATYRFDTSGVVGTHPFRFSTSPNGPTEYTNNVKSGSNYIQIEVNYDTPAVLYYYCTIHSGMGNAINVLRIDTLTTTASFNAFTQSYNNDSASFDTRITNNSSSISALSQSFYVFSGSYNTGSFTGSFYGVLTGSLNGTASYALNSDLLDGKDSTTFATTASNIFVGDQTVTGSLFTSGSNTLIGSTTLTGSLSITGSTLQIGNNTLVGNTLLSGSIIISGSNQPGSLTASVQIYGDIRQSGYHRFDPVSTNIDQNISASYIYVSGSTNDLYFTQNGNGYNNTTRLRWLEGNLYTGLLHGGLISIVTGSTTFNLSSGSGIVVSLNASLNDDPYPTIQYVSWNNYVSQSLTYLTSSIQTFIGIDSSGSIIQQTSPWSDGQYNTSISIGTVLHQNQTTVNASITYPNVAYGYKQRTYDFVKAFGPLKLSGLTIVPSGSLGLTVGSGTAFADGRNYQTDPNNPSYITDPGTSVSKIFRYYQSGSSFIQNTNGGLGFTVIDPANYNNNGTLTGVSPSTPFTIQRVFWYPNSATKGIVVYYGNAQYSSIAEAAANLNYETFNEVENTKQNAVYLGAIVIKYNGVFTVTTDYSILPGGIFRSVGGSGGGGSVVTTRLSDLVDVSIAAPSDGQPLVYNTTLNKWQNSSTLVANLTGNASTATSASHASNADSASYATTASYAVFATSASHASTASSADNFLVRGTLTAQTINVQVITASVEYVTGSTIFGSDLSNTHQFTGSVSITGSLSLNNSAVITSNQTSSMSVLSASYAISASYALSSSHADSSISSSYALSASYAVNSTSASYAISSSEAVNAQTANSASYAANATTASYAVSASQASNAVSSSYALTASHALNVPDTASYALNALSASYAISASQASNSVSSSYAISSSAAVNAQTANSSSYALTASYALFAENGGGGGISAIYIADEGATQGTASYFNFIGAGVTATVSNDTASITITGGGSGTAVQGASTVHSQSLVASTWSISHAINSRTPVVEVYDSSFNVIIPTRINNTGPFATDIYFDIPQAGYAIISTGGVIAVSGSNAILNQDVAATTWSFSHELSNKYPVFTIFDSNDDVIIPQAIHAVDSSSALIYFSTPRTGKAVASVAGPVNVVATSSLAITASYAISASAAVSASYAFSSSYAATASYADNFTVRGTLTAQTIVVQTITSSVIYSSGSNIFGDDLTDTQQLTGSVTITGSLAVNGSPVILSNQTSSMSVLSASYAISASQASNAVSSSYALTASYAANVPLTASYALQALSSSYAVSASQAANAVSSSYALTASYALNAGAGAGFPYSGSAEITGSLLVSESFVDFSKASYVTGAFTGSLLGNASTATTASYALYALSASNAPGYTVNLVQSTAASTWSFVHNLNSRNPLVQVYDSTYKQIIPNEIVAMDSATVEIRFEYSQSGYAVASNGGGLYITGSTSRIVQSAAATTWSFNHQLNTKYPAFEVYDSNDNVIIPAGIKAIDTDNAELYFAVPTTGLAIAEFSGINGLQDNAVSASHAESGSNFVVSNTLRLDGSLTDYSTVLSSVVGSNNLFTQATGSYTSAFVKYTVANGANARAGEMMVVWYNAQIQFTEATTTDIGATSAVTMSAAIVSGQLQINSQTNTSGWKIKSMATFI